MVSDHKELIKSLIPPLFFKAGNFFRRDKIIFKGAYSSWDEAMNHATGYDSELILNKAKEAILKVKSGQAAYERDTVLFGKMEYPFPLLAGLLRAAVANNGRLSVLDFGGSLGSSYYQCRSFLSGVKQLRWNIVEQERFIACGKELFENEELRFFYSIDECLQYEKPTVALFSGVMQYIKEPYALLENIIKNDFKSIIIDRTPFADVDDDVLSVEIVPSTIYEASMPIWIFKREKFLKIFQDKYSLLAEFNALDGMMRHGKTKIHFKGFIFDKEL